MRLAQRPEELRASVEENLRTLGFDSLPLVNVRRMDTVHRIPGTAEQDVDIDDQLAEMISMRDEGLISSIGLSSTTIEVLRRALPTGIACVQNPYSVLDRDDEAMLDLCVAEGIAWVPYFPLGGALPGHPKVADHEAVQAVATAAGATPAQVGLAWLLQHSPNTLTIAGTASRTHLEANVAVAQVTLDAEAMGLLDSLN
jgi:aryl-alcohol dehydrogenase-like predicted oxidoreductase